MANLGKIPGESASEPIESRRAVLPEPDPAHPVPDDAGAEAPLGTPDLGELYPEAARPSPLDEIAEAERENLPRD